MNIFSSFFRKTASRDFIQSDIGYNHWGCERKWQAWVTFCKLLLKLELYSDRAARARFFNMMMKSEKSLLASFKLFQRSRDLKKDSTCEEFWYRLKAVCCDECEEYVHRNTDVKHISDFARPCNIFISCLNVNGILTMQWWEDDIELPDVEVNEVEDRFRWQITRPSYLIQ